MSPTMEKLFNIFYFSLSTSFVILFPVLISEATAVLRMDLNNVS